MEALHRIHLNKGVTLIELMVVLILIAVSVCYIVPSYSHLQNRFRSERYIEAWVNSLLFAKTYAYSEAARITVCPYSQSRAQCVEWGEPHDAITISRLDQNTIIQVRALPNLIHSMQYKVAPNAPVVIFDSTGRALRPMSISLTQSLHTDTIHISRHGRVRVRP